MLLQPFEWIALSSTADAQSMLGTRAEKHATDQSLCRSFSGHLLLSRGATPTLLATVDSRAVQVVERDRFSPPQEPRSTVRV